MFENLTTARKEIEPKLFRTIHQEAMRAVEELKSKEALLIRALQEVDDSFTYRYLGFNSLYQYCLVALKLTEYQSMMYISVARKSKHLPALQRAIETGEVSISKVSRVVPVINEENQSYWLELLQTSTKREIEKEVAGVNPKAVIPEKTRYLNDTTIELNVPVSEKTFDDLKRAQELLIQKLGRAVRLAEVIAVVTEQYLAKEDPIKRQEKRDRKLLKVLDEKVKRSDEKKKSDEELLIESEEKSKSESLLNKSDKISDEISGQSDKTQKVRQVGVEAVSSPGHDAKFNRTLKDRVLQRDGGRCTYRVGGRRCTERVFLEIHHIHPKALGGGNEETNLTTHCSGHHHMIHGELH